MLPLRGQKPRSNPKLLHRKSCDSLLTSSHVTLHLLLVSVWTDILSANPSWFFCRVDQESSELQHQTHLDTIFMVWKHKLLPSVHVHLLPVSWFMISLCHKLLPQLLEENIVAFVKNELKRMQMVLSSGYPECLESRNEEEQRSSKAAFLEITVQFLRRMKQEALADCLQRGEGRFSKHAGKHLQEHVLTI